MDSKTMFWHVDTPQHGTIIPTMYRCSVVGLRASRTLLLILIEQTTSFFIILNPYELKKKPNCLVQVARLSLALRNPRFSNFILTVSMILPLSQCGIFHGY